MKYVSPEGYDGMPYYYVEESLVDSWLKRLGVRHGFKKVTRCEVQDAPEVFMDFGGMITADDLKLSVLVDGVTYSCWLIQADLFYEPLLGDPKTHALMDDHIVVKGHWDGAIFTPETAAKVGAAIKAESKRREPELMAWLADQRAKMEQKALTRNKKVD